MTDLGLDFFQGYVWGRAAALGEPTAAIVVATFGVFEPTVIGGVYDAGRSIASRHDVLGAREGGATESMHQLTDSRIGEIADELLAAVGDLDVTARPLFAGLRSLPTPTEPGGRLWRAAELVREHRGDGHLAACVAAGLATLDMNVLTEVWLGYPVGEYSKTRGYSHEAIEASATGLRDRGWLEASGLTPEGLALRQRIEAATDVSQAVLVDRLGGRLDAITTLADQWSSQLVTAGSFPADGRKRAAG